MLGWHVSVYRKSRGRRRPATNDSPQGTRLAVWQGGIDALKWLDTLVADGHAVALGGDGYPLRYTAPSEHVLPVILSGPPHAIEPWVRDADDVIIDERWAGRTTIDTHAVDRCAPGEWLLIEAWDES